MVVDAGFEAASRLPEPDRQALMLAIIKPAHQYDDAS